MLGRHEEELEREEVEKQLREVEMQEQTQAQMDEVERQARLREQGAREARGEAIGEGSERDLDEDVPEADAGDGFEDDDSIGDEENEEGEVDLDEDVPEAGSDWHYDTTRDLTDSENEQPSNSRLRPPAQSRPGNISARALSPVQSQSIPVDQHEHLNSVPDLDDDIPDMDDVSADLDDDVPDAEDDGGWEHTDTEMDESDMDISIMPPGATAHHVSAAHQSSTTGSHSRRLQPRQSTSRHQDTSISSMRRTSGNVPLPMAPPALSAAASSSRGLPRTQHLPAQFTPDHFDSDVSVSALISTGNQAEMSSDRGVIPQRSWLDPASARRNLFGISRNAPAQVAAAPDSSSTRQQVDRQHPAADQAPRQVSSGGLFTPGPQQQNARRQQLDSEPQSRTRSGRVIGRPARGRA